MKIKKIIFIITAAAVLIGAGNQIAATKVKKNSATVSKSNQSQSEAEAVAENFINSYILENFNIENSATTSKFKQEFKNRSEALYLADEMLQGNTLTQKQKDLVAKYPGIEYDPVLGGAIHNINPEHSKFKVESYNKNTGIFILRDTIDPIYAVNSCDSSYKCNPIYTKVSVKMVFQKNRWLVDGAGLVNMK